MENQYLNEKTAPQKQNASIVWGVGLGVISSIVTLIIWMVDVTFLGNWMYGLSILVISIVVLVLATKARRKQLGGYITFKEAMLACFSTYIVSLVISIIFSFVLYNVIDPELGTTMKTVAVENTSKMLENFGMDEDAMEEALVNVEEADYSYGAAKAGGNLLWGALVGAIISAIIALVIRKEKPIFE